MHPGLLQATSDLALSAGSGIPAQGIQHRARGLRGVQLDGVVKVQCRMAVQSVPCLVIVRIVQAGGSITRCCHLVQRAASLSPSQG